MVHNVLGLRSLGLARSINKTKLDGKTKKEYNNIIQTSKYSSVETYV